MDDALKYREAALRLRAARHGLWINKSRQRKRDARGFGGYMVVVLAGISTKWSSRYEIGIIGCGGRSTMKGRCSTSWSSDDAVLIGEEIASKAAEEAMLCTEAYHHGQA